MSYIDMLYIYIRHQEDDFLKIAVIGSRNLVVNIERYIPSEITELISGGGKGIDSLAEQFADQNCIPKRILKPEYDKYGRKAPLIRDRQIVDCADLVVAVWDGFSSGTWYTINYARRIGKPVKVYQIPSFERT